MLPGNLLTLANPIFGAGNLMALLFGDSRSISDVSNDSIDDDDVTFDHPVSAGGSTVATGLL